MMMRKIQLLFLLYIYLPPTINGKASYFKERNGKTVHLTSIGDLSSKDIIQMADDIAADKKILISDPNEDNSEREREEFPQTSDEGEKKFVDFLKSEYNGDFPEYLKETKADFDRNEQLEDNLESEQETAYAMNSENIPKSKNDQLDTYIIPKDSYNTFQENKLDPFDEDENALNKEKMKMFEKTAGSQQDTPYSDGDKELKLKQNENMLNNDLGTTRDDKGHTTTYDNDNDLNEGVAKENEHVDDSPNHVTDSVMSDSNSPKNMAEKIDTKNENTNNSEENAIEDELFDTEDVLKPDKKEKKKEKKKHEERKNEENKHQSQGILEAFDNIKVHDHGVTKKTKSARGRSRQRVSGNPLHTASTNNGNDEAILDFLDTLLDKDPKRLKDDVLAMTKELQDQDNLKMLESSKTSRDNEDVGVKEYNEIHEGNVQENDNVDETTEDFDYKEFKEEALKMHNEYRRRHNADAMTWSESLAKKAKRISQALLHSTRQSFRRELKKPGESIAVLPYSTKNIAKRAIDKWYDEILKFSFRNPTVEPETKDFTQIIWKGSKELGMGFAHTKDKKKTLVIAMYEPPGNDVGTIPQNLNTIYQHDPYADI